MNRRDLFITGLITAIAYKRAHAAIPSSPCLMKLSEFVVETSETPFFEHYHQLVIPVSALVDPPRGGLVVKTTPIDAGSYDVEGFQKFVASSGIDEKSLKTHSHDVTLTAAQLDRIGRGERDVEVRVISKNGNYVHNLLVTAPPSALVKVRKHKKD